jgi:hypothetical protein
MQSVLAAFAIDSLLVISFPSCFTAFHFSETGCSMEQRRQYDVVSLHTVAMSYGDVTDSHSGVVIMRRITGGNRKAQNLTMP